MKKMKLNLFSLALIFATINAYCHCEVPCGIYDDQLRVSLIKEYISTIEKAINKINEIQSAEDIDYNQLVRWINTKEQHANEIQHIAEQYFMTQRIKPVDPNEKEKYKKYIAQLTSMHEVIIYAMKSKQSLEASNIDNLRKLVDKFENAYFKKEEHKH